MYKAIKLGLLVSTAVLFLLACAQISTPIASNGRIRVPMATKSITYSHDGFIRLLTATPTSYSIPTTKLKCAFLLQGRARELISTVEDYEGIPNAINSIYGLLDEEIYHSPDWAGDDTDSYTWIMNEPYFGLTLHNIYAENGLLSEIDAYSYEREVPGFTIEELFDCLGEPNYRATYLTIDGGEMLKFPESTKAVEFWYEDLDVSLMLAISTADDTLQPNTRCYFNRIRLFAEEEFAVYLARAYNLEPWIPLK